MQNIIDPRSTRLPFSGSYLSVANQAGRSRRRISPAAGPALEKLSHAIEYLVDECLNDEGLAPFGRDGRPEAIKLLIAINRRIYFECPEVPSLHERLAKLICRSIFLRD